MMMKRTMMALAAVPAVLLAGGGVAVAQAAGAPAGTAVVQQADVHHSGGACRQHQMAPVVTVTARRGHQGCGGQGSCDRGHAADQQGAGAGSGMMTRAHHGDDCGDG
ncbi:MAG TPA: hypothetical protein VIK57_18150 [Streptosporangiaceae bacterium]